MRRLLRSCQHLIGETLRWTVFFGEQAASVEYTETQGDRNYDYPPQF